MGPNVLRPGSEQVNCAVTTLKQCIIAAQRLLPTAVATASAIFMSSTAVGSALGGLTGALGVATVGLPEIFFIPAAFAFLAVLGLGAMARSGALKSRPAGDSM